MKSVDCALIICLYHVMILTIQQPLHHTVRTATCACRMKHNPPEYRPVPPCSTALHRLFSCVREGGEPDSHILKKAYPQAQKYPSRFCAACGYAFSFPQMTPKNHTYQSSRAILKICLNLYHGVYILYTAYKMYGQPGQPSAHKTACL